MHKGIRMATSRGRLVELPDGQHIELRPLGLKDIAQMEEQSLADHKRQYLATFTKNQDMMPEAVRETWIHEAFNRAAEFTADTLPAKQTKVPKQNANGQRVVLETGQQVWEFVSLPYAFWWGSNTVAGMLYSVWLSARKAQDGISYDAVADLLGADVGNLAKMADVVAELSQPTAGNESAPE